MTAYTLYLCEYQKKGRILLFWKETQKKKNQTPVSYREAFFHGDHNVINNNINLYLKHRVFNLFSPCCFMFMLLAIGGERLYSLFVSLLVSSYLSSELSDNSSDFAWCHLCKAIIDLLQEQICLIESASRMSFLVDIALPFQRGKTRVWFTSLVKFVETVNDPGLGGSISV